VTAEAALIREARANDLGGIVTVDRLRSGAAKSEYWARILEQYGAGTDGRVALVAIGADDEVLGFLFGEVRAWEFGSERCGWIFSVAVQPDAERHGTATRLCDEAVRCFATMGVEMVRTMVRRSDVPLLALFRSMGFVAGTFSELERAVQTVPLHGEAHVSEETHVPEEEVA